MTDFNPATPDIANLPTHTAPPAPHPGRRAENTVREFFRAEIQARQSAAASEHSCRFQALPLGCPHIADASDVAAVVAMAKDDFDSW